MALTRNFKDTALARMNTDPEFKEALLEGDLDTGKAVLRDYINATGGFETLAQKTGTPSKSLMRMLSPSGNPAAKILFAIIKELQLSSGITLTVQSGHTPQMA